MYHGATVREGRNIYRARKQLFGTSPTDHITVADYLKEVTTM